MIRLFVGICVLFLFVGCVSNQKNTTVYEEYKPQEKLNPIHVEPKIERKLKQVVNKKAIKKTHIPASGSIKGFITNLTKDKNLWRYEIRSRDTSNHKLAYAKFTHTSKLANIGDFVYAIIKNNQLKEMFLIKKANYKKKIIHKRHKKTYMKKLKNIPKKTYKQTKKHNVIGIPAVESISLD